MDLGEFRIGLGDNKDIMRRVGNFFFFFFFENVGDRLILK